MNNNLYEDLKRIGINDELAHRVVKALDPEHVAIKQGLLVMQGAMLQMQLKTDSRYLELSNKIDQVNNRVDRVSNHLRVEIAVISRQLWITFGGLITTILNVFAVNWCFH